MASTWVSASSLYAKFMTVMRKVQYPPLHYNMQLELIPQCIGELTHSDFAATMKEYMVEKQQGYPGYQQIRCSYGDFFSFTNDAQVVLAATLAEWLLTQSVLPDTYFLIQRTIVACSMVRNSDGSIVLNIQNNKESTPLVLRFSAEQHDLLEQTLLRLTLSAKRDNSAYTNDHMNFNHTCSTNMDITDYQTGNSNTKNISTKQSKILKLFRNQQDDKLCQELVNVRYFLLYYFHEETNNTKKFVLYNQIHSRPEQLIECFVSAHNQQLLPQFQPTNYPRLKVQEIPSHIRETRKFKTPVGTIRMYTRYGYGVVQLRESYASKYDVFPFSAVVLPDGHLMLLNSPEHHQYIIAALKV
jgi:hypothetical protein